jgi:Capsule assembly protein Wzi/PAP2 superfamily
LAFSSLLTIGLNMVSPVCLAKTWEQEANTSSASTASTPGDTTKESSSYDKPVKKDADATVDNTTLGLHILKNLAQDQEKIWTTPARLQVSDAQWLIPFGLVTAGLFATDTEFSKHLSDSPTRLKYSADFSNYGIGGMAGLAGGIYLWGQFTHDDHKRETGILAAEAAIDSTAVAYALEYSLGRERPLQNDYQGNFWSGGASFPSEHAAVAWSIASVIAHEYPGPLTDVLAYGMASAISASRVTAKQHFPTDVLIGSAIGWLSGEVVYRSHHDPELGGSTWETFDEARDYFEHDRPRQDMGTTFVELDSWVYSALNRLAGLGYVQTSIAGLLPWTRMECGRLTEEAGEQLEVGKVLDGEAELLENRLRQEFSYEIGLLDGGRNLAAGLESAYARVVSISGPALTDGFHFGQTVSYDFGRPFERGTNGQAGGAVRADLGPLAFYVRAEYQHAPSAPAPSEAVRNIIALRDLVPEPPALPINAINRPRLLDAYVSVNVDNWQIVAGRQSLSWGPGMGGSFLWSNNAEPVDMVHLVNSEPIRLPGFLKYLGPARLDEFIGRLEDHGYIKNPFIYGQKINFKPLPNLEFGFGRTITIGGAGGDPLTTKNFIYSFFGQLTTAKSGVPGVPGDSHSGFDWTFYVPKVRNYLVFYGDWYADDDPIAFLNPPKNPYRPGIYITRFPKLPKLDLHLEVANTESPWTFGSGTALDGDLNYWNFVYRDGYTNNGQLIGNVVGRQGIAYQGWLTYWISPRNTLQLMYKNSAVDTAFIPGAGHWQDYSLKNELYLKSGFYLKSQLQYENISSYPILFNGPKSNVTAIVEFGFSPDYRER